MKARLLTFTVGLLCSTLGRAEPLSTEPVVGVASAYSSNPYLNSSDARSVSDVALLVSAPTNYDLDAERFSFSPSIRYSTGGNYASLESNYFHLNGSAAYGTDLDTITLTSGFGRDSSLSQSGLRSGGLGVRADTSSAAVDWQRILTSRAVFDFNAGWNRVLYNQAADQSGLVDYRYLSEGSSGTYAYNEITSLQVLASAGQYVALNGNTRSQNYSLQGGATRQLTELWTLTANAGYSRSNNSQNVYNGPFLLNGVVFGPFFEGTAHSIQQGPVFSTSLTRQGETLRLTASASRAYRPNGFEYLSRTDTAALDATYTRSDRWTFGATVDYQAIATPGIGGGLASVRYVNGQLSADYHWTPTWLVSLHTNFVKDDYRGPPPQRAQSTGVSLEVSRHFLRIDL